MNRCGKTVQNSYRFYLHENFLANDIFSLRFVKFQMRIVLGIDTKIEWWSLIFGIGFGEVNWYYNFGEVYVIELFGFI